MKLEQHNGGSLWLLCVHLEGHFRPAPLDCLGDFDETVNQALLQGSACCFDGRVVIECEKGNRAADALDLPKPVEKISENRLIQFSCFLRLNRGEVIHNFCVKRVS